MIVKLFGYNSDDRVDSVYIEIPKSSKKILDRLKHDEMLVCIGCKRKLLRNDIRYTFSQFASDCTKFTFHFVCDTCVVPIESVIKEVFDAARAKKQARPAQEEATAHANAGGAP